MGLEWGKGGELMMGHRNGVEGGVKDGLRMTYLEWGRRGGDGKL